MRTLKLQLKHLFTILPNSAPNSYSFFKTKYKYLNNNSTYLVYVLEVLLLIYLGGKLVIFSICRKSLLSLLDVAACRIGGRPVLCKLPGIPTSDNEPLTIHLRYNTFHLLIAHIANLFGTNNIA